MPELIEVEYYRRALNPIIGQQLASVAVSPEAFIRPSGTPVAAFDHLRGARLAATRRHGKLLVLELADDGGPVGEIGLRFGMTGRLLIDGVGPIDRLEYSSARNDAAWDRAILQFDARVSVRDQRRLGSIEIDPDTTGLGLNAETIDEATWTTICSRRRKSIKAVLLDQSLAAGLGNLLSDEVLWRSHIDPRHIASELDDAAIGRLSEQVPIVVAELAARGGSHTGDSFALRAEGEQCTICGHSMRHDTVATRSTWWCSGHQRQRATVTE